MGDLLVQPPMSRMHITDGQGVPTNYITRFFQRITSVLNGTTGIVASGVNQVTLGIGINISSGIGSPLSIVPGNIGDLYINLSGGVGTTLYTKSSGLPGTKTGWSALT